uniref:Uncharacterized protein n=1 Tax=Nicotiana tabacum TaxID=4097 RepID=A0A1S3ZVV5_TOBAC|nr:PREDICTED: uncharacterized protein LOC107791085 [Nicotiana tabacum]
MVDNQELPEAAQCMITEKEREVAEILLNLPELIAKLSDYGKEQLLPWGWKKRRSAINYPLTPLPSPELQQSPPAADFSPSPSPSPSSSPKLQRFKPRVANTKDQLLQQINELTQREKVYQQVAELLKVQSHLERQIEFNTTLKELTGATTLAYTD